ncbi:hypothetical protein ONE63_002002 [Megalurothrips usitatus]|uniref:Galactosylgalactosylxylosylprotein 3-beta-glucuronosyltransferase n=1 Tax=Megalurothrips usitatus TaxID=439358 RepID=A0AAV7XGY5_9NEOP|nr:hypothetical protein ONE63_002002 [Megalurothrips usitatus]
MYHEMTYSWPRQNQDMKNRNKYLSIGCIVIVVVVWLWLGTSTLPPPAHSNAAPKFPKFDPEFQNDAARQRIAELESEVQYLKATAATCRVHKGQLDPDTPVIYAITPTYARPVQKAELTRLSHTFMLVQNLHWIIVEDADDKTPLVANLLRKSDIPHTHLVAPTPQEWKRKEKEPNWKKPRGVLQRNKALEWLRNELSYDVTTDQGVVYFADDDNSYSMEIFDEMRKIKKVGVWPVGLVGGLMVEKPILNKTTHKVAGFNSGWRPERPFPIDMAGFAINLGLLVDHPEAQFSLTVEGGYQESEILRHLVTREELEPLADYCTKVYVWHTRTEAPKLSGEAQLRKKGMRSDQDMEV